MNYIKLLPLALFLGVGIFAAKEISASKGDNPENPDYLLILGCRVRGDKAEDTLTMRINRAKEYLRENPDTVAVCCGGIVHDDQTAGEAEVIRRELIAGGIAPERLILENRSRTTQENFINAKAIIEGKMPLNKASVAYLSSDFHLLRAGKIASRCGITALSVAADSPHNKKIKNYLRELICMPAVYFDR